MKQSIFALAVVAILTSGVQVAAQQQAPPTPPQETPKAAVKAGPPAGKWVMNVAGPQGETTVNLDVKVDATNKVTGTLEGPQGATAIVGEVKDGVLGFTINFDAGGTPIEIYFEGKVGADDKLTGTMALGEMGKFPFTATRAKG